MGQFVPKTPHPPQPSLVDAMGATSTPTLVWERMPGESQRWYNRFNLYRMAGARRSIEGVWKTEVQPNGRKGKRPSHHWYEAAREFQWINRSIAWDAFQQEEDERTWTERRRQQREREWHLADLLMTKAESILELPITRQHTTREVRGENGELIEQHITIEPVGVTARDAGTILKYAAEIARLSAGMQTGEVKVTFDWREAAIRDGYDPDDIKLHMVNFFAAGLAGSGDEGGLPRSEAENPDPAYEPMDSAPADPKAEPLAETELP